MALFGTSVVQDRCGSLSLDWERKQQQQQHICAIPDHGEINFSYQFRSETSDGLYCHEGDSPTYHQPIMFNAPGWEEDPQGYAGGLDVADGNPWCSSFTDVHRTSDSLAEFDPQSLKNISPDGITGYGFFTLDNPYEDGGIPGPKDSMQSSNERLWHNHESSSLSVDTQSSFAGIYQPSSFRPSNRSEQLSLTSDDLYPDDSGLGPHRQEVRFLGDLYTPTYVRGVGKMREGWCGICKPGRWLLLKNSAFWYDKAFTHGISAATGVPFDNPREMRPAQGQSHFWEGMCGTCGEWIALISNKKKGTSWFRHAYKVCKEPYMVMLYSGY